MLLALTGWEIGLLVVRSWSSLSSPSSSRSSCRARGRSSRPSTSAVFIAVCIVLFAAQMTAVAAPRRAGGGAEAGRGRDAAGGAGDRARLDRAGSDRSDPHRATEETTGTTPPTEPAGDPAAGKEVFASAGLRELPHARRCRHHRHGRPEPRRDMPPYELAVDRVTNGCRRHAAVQGHAERAADPGRRRVRLLRRRRLTAEALRCPAWRGVRAAEGARLEIAYVLKGASRVQIPPSPYSVSANGRVVVLGAGSSGEHFVGALRRLDRDVEIVVVEQGLAGGECSYYACIPTKTLLRPTEALAAARIAPGAAEAVTGEIDVERVFWWRDQVTDGRDDSWHAGWIAEQGAELVRGEARVTRPGVVDVGDRELEYSHLVVATGSSPAVPPIDGPGRNRVLDEP